MSGRDAAEVAGGLAVPAAGAVDATAVVPPKSPISLANAAFKSSIASADTRECAPAAPDVVPPLAISLMSAVSSAMIPR